MMLTEEVLFLNKGPLVEKSIEFAINLVSYYNWLKTEKREFVISNQLLRSGTSIGANVHEAIYAVSKPDFINKMQIALKEAAETEYWLLILERTGYLPEYYIDLKRQSKELTRILIASMKTAKGSR